MGNNIHSSVPEHIKNNRKYTKPEEIADILRIYLRKGRENALTCKQLAERLGFSTDRTYQNIRMAQKILFQRGIPAISLDNGLFIATCPKDFELYKQKYLTQIAGLQKNIDLIEKRKSNFIRQGKGELF